MKKERIWEVDALRGVGIWIIVILHLLYDIQAFLGIPVMEHPVSSTVMACAGPVFVYLSGLSATLGGGRVRRGLHVFGCGMVITVVTWGMAALGFVDGSIIIYYGILHLLGTCMILWAGCKKLPTWALAVLGIAIIALGYWMEGILVDSKLLFPLGLCYPGFASGDYFPLFPNLGRFFLGAVLGRILYKEKTTHFPGRGQGKTARFFRWCGTHSLWIYLIHQPVLVGVVMVIAMV